MRPSFHHLMRISISSSAALGKRDLHTLKLILAKQMPRSVVQNLLHGRYEQPLRVIAFNVDEGWSRDVSEGIARKVREIAEHKDYELTQGTLDFIEAHMGRVLQPTLPLW
jgi:hypothetical protein